MLFRTTILGIPRSKKTHGRIVFVGKPCRACHRGQTPIMLPSDKFVEWEKEAAPQLREAWAAANPGAAEVVCARCDGREKDPSYSGPCVGCGGTGQRPPRSIARSMSAPPSTATRSGGT